MKALTMLLSLAAAQPAPAQEAALLTGADLSRRFGLKEADARMRDGKYLEAAVAYRNALIQPGDREAVRVPFALALMGAGEPAYAGIELRRAGLLCTEFAKIRPDIEDLFGSKDALSKVLDKLDRKEPEGDGGDGFAALAYGRWLAGQTTESRAALAKYISLRGEDAFSKALGDLSREEPAAAAPPPNAPPEIAKLQKKVDAMTSPGPKATETSAPPAAPPEAARAPVAFVNFPPKPRPEVLEK